MFCVATVFELFSEMICLTVLVMLLRWLGYRLVQMLKATDVESRFTVPRSAPMLVLLVTVTDVHARCRERMASFLMWLSLVASVVGS